MKKLFAILLSALLLTFGMAIFANATEYVYYENDFSDAATISDFTQYRGEWAIENGVLKLAGAGKVGIEDQVFMLYTADDAIMNLTDYILEVDITPNALAGVLARCDTTLAYAESATGYCGYQATLNYATTTSNGSTTESFSIGSSNTAGGWVGALGAASIPSSRNYLHHFKMTVEGPSLTVVVTDEYGQELWNYTAVNDEWAMGTFGLTAIGADMSAAMVNIGMLQFDNLKVTAIGDVGTHLANGGALADYKPTVASNPVKVEKVNEDDIDFTKTEYVLYENDFSDAETINDFIQARGTWVIKDGKLMLEATEEGKVFSFLAYTADKTGYVGLASDYTVEVDLYGVQAAAGVLSYVDTGLFSGDTDNTFYGYLSFASNDASKAAIGASDASGTYANIKVSGSLLIPGNNYHIVVTHLDGKVSFSFTDIDSGELVYEHTINADKWSTGSFGFRMRANNGGNVNALINPADGSENPAPAYFDNLKVTVTGNEAALINAGFSPNAEIVYNAVEEKPAVTDEIPAETTADVTAPADTTAVTEAPSKGGVSPVIIVVIVAVIAVVIGVVVVITKKKK